MRKLFLFAAALVMASIYSCEIAPPEVKECEENNTGDVTITNNTDMSLYFDVTGEDGNTTENRLIESGKSTTYTIPAGTVKIWASRTNENDDFVLVNTQYLAQCDEIDYQSPSETCELFNVTDVKIINNTGEIIWVDIKQGDYSYGKIMMYINDHDYYFDVDVSEKISIGATFNDNDWKWHSDVTLTACRQLNFTWNANKFQEAKEASKTQLPVEVNYKARERKK